MNATFTQDYFLRMAHLGVLLSPFGQFDNKVSLTYDSVQRCPRI